MAFNSKDTCALMMTKMPLQQGWQRQLEDGNNAIAKKETTLLWIKGNNAIVTRAMTPAQQQQGLLCIDKGNNAIIMRATIANATTAKTPAHWWQWHHHNEGNNASLRTSNKSNDASLTMAETPAHQQQWQRHCDNSNNCHHDNSEDACTSTMMTPSQWEQWRQFYNEQWGQRH